MSTVIEELKQLIANDLDLNIKSDRINEDISLLEDGVGLDSMAIMEFVSLIEAKFGIEFSDEELSMEPFQSLTALSESITQKTAN